ncbi:MAG: hypothetical protein JXA07_10480, partial [Spirochaetes bacterium]|nr:hypothetical protein [Spirochaetota bacterium]
TFNQIYNIIKIWGLFNYEISISGTLPANPLWTFRVRINDDFIARGTIDDPLSPDADVTYSNRVELSYNASPVFQFFFDDISNSSIEQGCLLIVKPYRFETGATHFFNENGIFEGRVKSDKTLYITFDGTPWTTTPIGGTGHSYPIAGRGKMTDDGTNYNVTAMVYTHVDGTMPYYTCTLGSGESYYTLAYIAQIASPNYSTALWGWSDSAKNDRVCSFAFNAFGNYGYFNSIQGFVCDGMPDASDCPEDSRYPSGAAVSTLYTNMANTAQEFSAASITSPGVAFLTFD